MRVLTLYKRKPGVPAGTLMDSYHVEVVHQLQVPYQGEYTVVLMGDKVYESMNLPDTYIEVHPERVLRTNP